MQIAAANPSYLNREAVPAEAIENEKKIIIAQMANDPKAANKPDAIKEKMAPRIHLRQIPLIFSLPFLSGQASKALYFA